MATKNPRIILWGVDSTGEMREVGVYDDGSGGYTLVAPSSVAATVDVSDRAARLLGEVSITSVDITSLPTGSEAMADSTPVTIATDDTLVTALKTALEAIQSTAGVKKITDALPAGTNAIGKLAANSGVDIGDVDVLSLPTLPAGTNAIGKLAANSGVDIGDVDVLSLPSLPAGANSIGTLGANSGVDIGDVDVTSLPVGNAAMAASTPVTIASDDTLTSAVKTAVEVMDDWDESDRAKVNPIVGQAGIASGTGVDGATVPRVTLATDVALPAGTNAIGKLAANTGVDIGDVDVTSLPVGNTNMAASTPVTIASDDTLITALKTALEILDDWDESNRAMVNPIVGQAGVAAGAGVAGVTVQRTVEAVDSPLPLALGIPDQANMGKLAFDASATVALTASSTYQIIATEACHFHVTDGAEAATSSHMFLPAGQYYLLRTGSTIKNLYAIKSVTAGNLHYCKMLGNE